MGLASPGCAAHTPNQLRNCKYILRVTSVVGRTGVELGAGARAGVVDNLFFIYWFRGKSGSDDTVGWPPDCSIGMLRVSLWHCGFGAYKGDQWAYPGVISWMWTRKDQRKARH